MPASNLLIIDAVEAETRELWAFSNAERRILLDASVAYVRDAAFIGNALLPHRGTALVQTLYTRFLLHRALEAKLEQKRESFERMLAQVKVHDGGDGAAAASAAAASAAAGAAATEGAPSARAARAVAERTLPQRLAATLSRKGEALSPRVLRQLLEELRAIIDPLSDDELQALMNNLGGHDIETLTEAFRAQDAAGDQPTCFIAYTIKGMGLPFQGHKDNHSGLMTETHEIIF